MVSTQRRTLVAAPLKNLYNSAYIKLLHKNITQFYPIFQAELFVQHIFNAEWEEKELKQRMKYIAETLGNFLPKEYPESIKILKDTFSAMNYDFGLENMIFQEYVALFGVEDFDLSMEALAHFTINSSSEFAIRTFILKYPQKTMQQMQIWTQSKNEHIRRLASEGCRPRLPWATSLPMFQKDPTAVLYILEFLKNDTSKYVQKSVANNLNDISKDHPDIVIQLAKKWRNEKEHKEWILKHGMRTLLKASNAEVLALFGFKTSPAVELKNFTYTEYVTEEKNLYFSFELTSQEALENLRIEFALLLLRRNGQHNRKVFQIAQGKYLKHTKSFEKSYSFKKITTRVYYKGLQKLQIIVNGTILKEVNIMLS